MKKNNLINFLILVLLYVGISTLPFNLIIKHSDGWVIVCQLIAQAVFAIFAMIFTKKSTELELNKKMPRISWLFFMPCVIACLSNFLYFVFVPADFGASFSSVLIPQVFLYVIVAFNEEFLFRVLFINNSEIKKPIFIILISAAIFGICHITNFLTSFNPADLLIVGYTFLLGLVLGMAYLFTKNFILVFLLHLGFNLLNKVLFEALCKGVSNIWLYLAANGIIVAILGTYLVLLYFNKKSIIEPKED